MGCIAARHRCGLLASESSSSSLQYCVARARGRPTCLRAGWGRRPRYASRASLWCVTKRAALTAAGPWGAVGRYPSFPFEEHSPCGDPSTISDTMREPEPEEDCENRHRQNFKLGDDDEGR